MKPVIPGIIMLLFSSQLIAQCTKDIECKGERICIAGECVDPPQVQHPPCTKDVDCLGDSTCEKGECVAATVNPQAAGTMQGASVSVPVVQPVGNQPAQHALPSVIPAVASEIGNVTSQIHVLESSGKKVNNDSTHETIIVFKTKKPGQIVPIEQIYSESQFFAIGPGGSAGGYGATFSKVCDAPAEIKLTGGTYLFRVHGGKQFNITAAGGNQIWEVQNNDLNYLVPGGILLGGGISGLIVGVLVMIPVGYSFDKKMIPAAWTTTGISAIATIIGVSLFKNGTGQARLLANDNNQSNNKLNPTKKPTCSSFSFTPNGLTINF